MKAIIQLNGERLRIYWGPFSFENSFIVLCFGNIIIFKFNFINGFIGELKLLILGQDLDPVCKLVGANLLGFE